MSARKTVGEVLIELLEANGVDTVFGIPGVHTVELYRGLANSKIRHITPRHELSAGFMADGYARVSGKPGVCLLITGPGLTNAITAMAQARADSVPLLVISGVNPTATIGHEAGHLHELPDQIGMVKTLALHSHRLERGADLEMVLERSFAAMTSARPGPVHIEIPVDVMSEIIPVPVLRRTEVSLPQAAPPILQSAAALCAAATKPVILLGGGATGAETELRAFAEMLDAPVVTTVNARGMLASHPLLVPASPSLPAVRDLIGDSDLVIAVGTQMGPTDYDMYSDGRFPTLKKLVRIDVDAMQATRGALADVAIVSDARTALTGLLEIIGNTPKRDGGAGRAAATREAAFDGLEAKLQREIRILEVIKTTLPGCLMVGDSTQLVYAGNLYGEIDRVHGWFNSATGYGALGYAPPAAIGASLALPDAPVVCIVGDGGFQFCLSELGTAADENTPVVFLVWNNGGYQEIENYMVAKDISPVGVRPTPPDFVKLARAYGIAAESLTDIADLAAALGRARDSKEPRLIEIRAA